MTFGLKASADGLSGSLQLGGVDKVTVGANGIVAGSYAPDSITSTELAPGAMVETSPSSLIGYGTGAGGSVTQATSKSTAVTLNKPCGRITMNNAALAAGATVSFNLSNTLVTAAGTQIIINLVADGVVDPSFYEVWATPGGSVANIFVKNVTGGSLSQAINLNFTLVSMRSS